MQHGTERLLDAFCLPEFSNVTCITGVPATAEYSIMCYCVQSVRTKETLPILKAAKRVVLLTGTPALSRPKELFPLLSALVPSSKLTMKAFGERYCQLDPWKQRFGGVYDGECQSIASHKLITNSLCFAQTSCMHTPWAPACCAWSLCIAAHDNLFECSLESCQLATKLIGCHRRMQPSLCCKQCIE